MAVDEQKIADISEEINKLVKELDDEILLGQYYSKTDPKDRIHLEEKIAYLTTIKNRLVTIKDLFEQNIFSANK